ncbi:MAG: cardiolipin synthase, partial [Alicyclobacillaceae bacterium]|nr:cardiolipin synthase [Alicyclobacillaceae bacterium]
VQRRGVGGAAETPAAGANQFTLPDNCPSSVRRIEAAVRRLVGRPPARGGVQVLPSGPDKYRWLMNALERATRQIDMEYFIFRNDHVGRQILAILMERARCGVRVRFLKDGLGSWRFPRPVLRKMEQAGIECRTFFPLRPGWLWPMVNLRDHTKIVVIDGTQAFTGGINIGDEYTGRQPGVGPWRDTHLRLTGPAVQTLSNLFEVNWSVASPATGPDRQTSPQGADGRAVRAGPAAPARIRWAGAVAGEWAAEWAGQPPAASVEDAVSSGDSGVHPAWVQTVESGPDRPVQSIRQLFFVCLTQAERTVDVTTPYFVPDIDLTMAMQTAALRGVRVRLLLPRHCDHRIVGLASHTYYDDLMASGVEVYLYDGGVLHAKVMTVDGWVSVVGAANFDLRSFRLNYEVSELIVSQGVAQELKAQFEQDLKKARRLTYEEWARRGRLLRVAERAARLAAPLL